MPPEGFRREGRERIVQALLRVLSPPVLLHHRAAFSSSAPQLSFQPVKLGYRLHAGRYRAEPRLKPHRTAQWWAKHKVGRALSAALKTTVNASSARTDRRPRNRDCRFGATRYCARYRGFRNPEPEKTKAGLAGSHRPQEAVYRHQGLGSCRQSMWNAGIRCQAASAQ